MALIIRLISDDFEFEMAQINKYVFLYEYSLFDIILIINCNLQKMFNIEE